MSQQSCTHKNFGKTLTNVSILLNAGHMFSHCCITCIYKLLNFTIHKLLKAIKALTHEFPLYDFSRRHSYKWLCAFDPGDRRFPLLGNREYLAPKIRSMNNRFHSEAKLSWSYDYPLANLIATISNQSFAKREMPLFSCLCPSFRVSSENIPAKGF